jgi:hypothetical protein
VVCLLALGAALVLWGLNSGGGGGGHSSSAPNGSHTPDATITAGPTPTGTHISGRPGGRAPAPGDSTGGGASSDGGADGGTSSGTTAGGGVADGGTSAGASTGGAGGSAGSSGAGSSGGASTSGQEVPVGSTLPDCSPGPVSLALTSVQNSYAPGQTPAFRLRASNTGDVTCKLDFGPKSAVFTVTRAADSNHVWASDDCPTTGSYLLQVPAHSSTTFTLRWNGKNSSPNCAKPKGQQAAPGTYLLAERMSGYGTKQVSFVLSQD